MTNAVNLASAASSGFLRNRILNGEMTIDQRNGGNSVVLSTAGYCLDRWYLDFFGTGVNGTTVQQLSSGAPAGYLNYLRIQNNSTASTNLYLSQSIETINCYDLAGKQVTVSFWYRTPVASSNAWNAYITHSTTANTKTTNPSGNFSDAKGLPHTTSWSFISFTTTLPANALTVGVIFINGYNNTVNGAQFDITGVQLELGSVATPFERRLYGTELALCQRYYEKGDNQICIGGGTQGALTDVKCQSFFKVTKRVPPTMTITSAAPSIASGAYGYPDYVYVTYSQGNSNNFASNWTAMAEL